MHVCVYVCENSSRRGGISFLPPSTLLHLFLLCRCLCHHLSVPVSLLCPPLCLTLAWWACHSLGLSLCLPLGVPSPSTQSVCWQRSTGYLGNHCRASTCDWPGWGPPLGWQADFWGDSWPQSPLGEGHSLGQECVCHGEQGSLAGEGIPALMRTQTCRIKPH